MDEERFPEKGYVWQAGRIVRYEVRDFRTTLKPSILVVIPYYKAAEWIVSCLNALAKNSEPHDILIVNDGGDSVLDIIAPQSNLVVCGFENNLGLIGALNFAAGFALREGYRYYVRQDADDLSMMERLRAQRSAMEREGADLIICGVRAVDEQGSVLWSGVADADQADIRRSLAIRNPAVHSTWFMRTDLFTRIGCYDERYKGAEDFELLQRIVRRGKIVVMPDQLVHYLIRSDSVLSSSRTPALQTLRVLMRYFDPSRMEAYFGIARASLAALASRNMKTRVRRMLRRVVR